MWRTSYFLYLVTLLIANNPASAKQEAVYDLSIEELMNLQVTSVSKKAQALSDAPSAIFVINQDDIRRSGVTNVPDALRMVPGLDVARIDSNKWAVTSRGFNGRFANKLLVLIDGRSIYTQAFSGVYWENQDVMLEDIDRIEVIRGPGATHWGANAVNGVINIITKHSEDTQGGLFTAGGGSQEMGFGSMRYGMKLGDHTTGRIYAKGFKRNEFNHLTGESAHDDWDKVQGGFRVDSSLSTRDTIAVSGDIYHSNINQNLTLPSLNSPTFFQNYSDTANAFGGNINSLIEHTFSPTSGYKIRLFYDTYVRNELFLNETRRTFDIDFQHNFSLNTWNELSWGLGYRYLEGQYRFPKSEVFSLRTSGRKDNYFNAFVQNESTLIDSKLWLTLGSKFEHNDYTGFEFQPTAKIMWIPHKRHRFWGAISRAVRTPSLFESEFNVVSQFLPPNSQQNPNPFPVSALATGTHAFRAEELLAYELGYRFTFAKELSVDSTLFYNDYSSLRSFSIGPSSSNRIIPFIVDNSSKGETYGFETAVIWQMLDWCRWDLNYSYLHTKLHNNPFYQEAVSPQQKSSIRLELNPWQNINLDFWLRYVDKRTAFTLTGPAPVDGYVTMDVRAAWKPVSSIELSITGQNLLDNSHLETLQEFYTQPTEIPRSVYGKIVWDF